MGRGRHSFQVPGMLWSPRLRWLRDAAPALVVLPTVFAPSDDSGPQPPTVGAALLVLAAAALVVCRRRYPRVAAVAAVLATVLVMAASGPFVAYVTAMVIVVFSVARHTDRPTAAVVATTAAVVVGVAAALLLPQSWGNRPFVQVAAMVGFAAAAGDASRSRRAYIDTITERARRAEETKESEARSRVAEERLKIARDLHDVMAHQIAVISMHAGVASQALPTRPDDAERALATIRQAARTVLGEIASLLRVLRAADPSRAGQAPDLAPVPGLSQLQRLVTDFTRGGLRVDLRMVGEPVELPAAVDMVAYRVIQEGLTNAQKHGSDSSALLQVEYDQQLLEVSVTNTVTKTTGAGHQLAGGHGLIGARERVAAVQGAFDTSFGPGPVHRLVARLPLPEPATPDAS